MTSRRLKSAALLSVNRTSPVILLTLLLYGTAIWQSFQVFLMMPFIALPITVLSLLLNALQVLAGSWIWNLFRKGAVLAVAISAVRLVNLTYQSYLFSSTGMDSLTLAGMVLSLGLGVLTLGLILLSWRRMH